MQDLSYCARADQGYLRVILIALFGLTKKWGSILNPIPRKGGIVSGGFIVVSTPSQKFCVPKRVSDPNPSSC